MPKEAQESTAAEAVIETCDLHKTYGQGAAAVHALAGIDLRVLRGEFVSIMGQSGSGKSTLLHVLGCLHRATAGSYRLGDREVSTLNDRELSSIRNSHVGIVFQKYNLLAHEDIVKNVELPLVYAGAGRWRRRARATEMLTALGLGDRLRHNPTELSGGQDQRVAIARALVMNPVIILADEPTGNLDSETGKEVMAIFQRLHRGGSTIVMVTHNRWIAGFSERIVYLRDGVVERHEQVDPHEPLPTDVDLSFLGGAQ